MKRVPLRSKEVNKLLTAFGVEVKKKDTCFLVDDKILLINKVPSFFYREQRLIPTLKFLQTRIVLKKIVVDMGALRFVTKGADIMRPGIVEIDETITKGDPVVVVDETHGKPIAVGIALFDGPTMISMDAGKVIQNIHYVGDELWRT